MKLNVGIVQPQFHYDENESAKEMEEVNYQHALELLQNFEPGVADLIVFPEYYPCNNFDEYANARNEEPPVTIRR